MTRIDFAFGTPDRLRTACEVIRKHVEKGRRLVVYSSDAAMLKRFDRMLWGFEPTAFVPHVDADDPLAPDTPVVFARTPLTAPDPAAWLVNLDRECPPDASDYGRILEIVGDDEPSILEARERWRRYKAQGLDVRAHSLPARPNAR